MKKFITLLLIILFSISTVMYTTTIFSVKASEEISSSIAQKQIEKQIRRLVNEVNSLIPIVEDKAVDNLILKIEKDPQTSEIIDSYAKLFVSDITQNENKLAVNINDDLKVILNNYTHEFSDVFGDFITPKYKDDLIQALIDKVDVTDYYHSVLNKVEDNLGDNEIKVIKVIDFYYKNFETIRNISLLVAITSFIFALILNLSVLAVAWVLILSSLSSLLGHLSLHFGIVVALNQFLSNYKLNIDYSIFKTMELGLLLVLILSIVLRSVSKSSIRRKATD